MRRAGEARPGQAIEVRLGLRPPYDGAAMLGFFARRALNGVDLLSDSMFEHQTRILREIVNALFPDAEE